MTAWPQGVFNGVSFDDTIGNTYDSFDHPPFIIVWAFRKNRALNMKYFTAFVSAFSLLLALGCADPALAKDKGGKPKGKKVQVDGKPGKGPKTIPPGQVKRYTRGAKLPSDLNYTDIGELSKWKLKPPGNGNRYIRVDNEVLEVSDDLSTVVDAVGIVGDLLK